MGRGSSGGPVGGASLLYGAPTRRQSSVDIVAKVDRLVRSGDMEKANAALGAVARGGAAPMEELERAATRIAITQVIDAYDTVPAEILDRLREYREEEEAFLVDSQTKYLVVCAVGDIEPPDDPRLHLYRRDEPGQTLLTSPLSYSLLPNAIRGRTPSQYLHDLPASHKEVMAHLLGSEDAEGSALGELIDGELMKFLIEGDGDGFSGIAARIMHAQKALGRRTPSVPLSGPEERLLTMALREDLHPLPGTWGELRERLARGAAVDRIGCGIAAKTSGLALSDKATDADWGRIAVSCILDPDWKAEKGLRETVREVRRRPTR